MKHWTPDEIVEWHKKTFPKATFSNQLMKLEEEVREVYYAIKNGEKEKSYDEMADVIIVSISLSGRFDSILGAYFINLDEEYPVPNIYDRIDKKMNENVKRKWTFENGVYRHIDNTTKKSIIKTKENKNG